MPQQSANLLNKTVFAAGQAAATVPPDSLSVRLVGLARGTYVKINGISWGVVSGADADLTALDFGDLLILRNEIFDPNFTYTLANASASKDVVWNDVLERNQFFFYRDFAEPIKLNGASEYLIVMPAPVVVGTPAAPFSCSLCVRGEICDDTGVISPPAVAPQLGDMTQR